MAVECDSACTCKKVCSAAAHRPLCLVPRAHLLVLLAHLQLDLYQPALMPMHLRKEQKRKLQPPQ
eukprot:1982690-Amphidinium_carterae.1